MKPQMTLTLLHPHRLRSGSNYEQTLLIALKIHEVRQILATCDFVPQALQCAWYFSGGGNCLIHKYI